MTENTQPKVDSNPTDEACSADEPLPLDELDRKMGNLGLYSLPLGPSPSVPEPQ